jgi:hypothetical protein
MADTPERKALYSYSRDYRTDPEGLERMRESLSSIPNWHDRAPINCNSLARLLDTIEALSRPMEAVAWREKVIAIREAIWNDINGRRGFDFYDLDDDVQDEIRTAWDDAIIQALAVIPTEGGEGRETEGKG